MTKEGEILLLFTIRKRTLRRLCFYTCLSFCPQGGMSRPRPRGEFGGSGWGVSRPRPEGVVSRPRPEGVVSRPRPEGWCPGPGSGGVEAQAWGCVSQHALRQTPPSPADGYCCSTHPTGMHSCELS